MLSAACQRSILAFALATLTYGCTFYTACPTGNATNGPPNTGGAAGSNGTAPAGAWVDVTANLTSLQSECGNLSYLSTEPNQDRLIASVALQGLWSTTDGGDSWVAIGQGSGSDQITNRGSWVLYDPDHPGSFWEAGTYNAGGVYKTEDDGDTFKQVGSITHNDFLSVDFGDANRQTMLASGHEQPRTLYRSVNGGTDFVEIGDNNPNATLVCPFPVLMDVNTYLLGCGTLGGGMAGIFHSTDAGVTWQQVSAIGAGSPPLAASDGSIYWASEDSAGIVRSTDQGLTWSKPLGANLVSQLRPVELPDQSIATASANNIIVSRDHGVTWTLASAQLPFPPTGLLYSSARKAFYIWHFTCDIGPVPEKAIMRFDFDYSAH